MALLNVGRELSQNMNTIENRFFRGKCVDNNDPFKIGRVRIRVEGIHDNFQDSQIPWSLSALNMCCNAGTGGIDIPDINTNVWILYLSEQGDSSLYFGASYTRNSILSTELLEDYPNTYGFVDSYNNVFVVNKIKGYFRLLLKDGAELDFHSNGLYIKTSDTVNDKFPEGLQIHVNGNAKTLVSGNHLLQAENFTINCNNFELNSKSAKFNVNGGFDVLSKTLTLNSDTFTSNSNTSTLNATGSNIVQSSGTMKVIGGGGSYDATAISTVDGKPIGLYKTDISQTQFSAFAPVGVPDSPSATSPTLPTSTTLEIIDGATPRPLPEYKSWDAATELQNIKKYDDKGTDDNKNNVI